MALQLQDVVPEEKSDCSDFYKQVNCNKYFLKEYYQYMVNIPVENDIIWLGWCVFAWEQKYNENSDEKFWNI